MKKTLAILMFLLVAVAHAETPPLNTGHINGHMFLQMSKSDQMTYVAGVVDGYDFGWALSMRNQAGSNLCRLRWKGLSLETMVAISADYVRALSAKEKEGAVPADILGALRRRVGADC